MTIEMPEARPPIFQPCGITDAVYTALYYFMWFHNSKRILKTKTKKNKTKKLRVVNLNLHQAHNSDEISSLLQFFKGI
jgi:hypothetical protein